MTRAAKRGVKIFTYAAALLTGAVLAILGVQSKSHGNITTDVSAVPSVFGETVYADDQAAGTNGSNTGAANWTDWSGGDGNFGDAGG